MQGFLEVHRQTGQPNCCSAITAVTRKAVGAITIVSKNHGPGGSFKLLADWSQHRDGGMAYEYGVVSVLNGVGGGVGDHLRVFGVIPIVGGPYTALTISGSVPSSISGAGEIAGWLKKMIRHPNIWSGRKSGVLVCGSASSVGSSRCPIISSSEDGRCSTESAAF